MIFSGVTCDSSCCTCPDSAEIPGDFGGDSRISSSWVLLLPVGLRALKMFSYAPKWGRYRFLCKRICAAVRHVARRERSRKLLLLHWPLFLCYVGTAG